VVKTIYSSVKQVSDTLFAPGGQAFSKALLVQYPRKDSWTIAFLTGTPGKDVAKHLQGEYLSVYVPTTPNPTSGFFLMMRRADVIELDMSVDEALKYVISMAWCRPSTPGSRWSARGRCALTTAARSARRSSGRRLTLAGWAHRGAITAG